IPFARFANLLHHLGVDSPPPRDFVMLALTIAQYRIEQYARLNFERHPLWFVRAVLRERERVSSPSDVAALHRELLGCLDWMIEARPNPDANQQHAGWPWILEQARAHRAAKELARAAPWPVPPPVAEMAWGPYRVVAIDCLAELAAEAEAMKNCLLNDED